LCSSQRSLDPWIPESQESGIKGGDSREPSFLLFLSCLNFVLFMILMFLVELSSRRESGLDVSHVHHPHVLDSILARG